MSLDESGTPVTSPEAEGSDDGQLAIFVSHVRSDRRIANCLREALESRGVTVFTDESIDLGEVWAERILSAIRRSAAMVVLLSKDWEDSAWSFAELSAALADGRTRRIIPVRLSSTVDIPHILRPYQRYDIADGGGNASIEQLADAVVKSIQMKPGLRQSSGDQAATQGTDPIGSVRRLSTLLGFVEQQLRSPAREQRQLRLIFLMMFALSAALLVLTVVLAVVAIAPAMAETDLSWLLFLLGLFVGNLFYFLRRRYRDSVRRRGRS
jgi:hypothetical protein